MMHVAPSKVLYDACGTFQGALRRLWHLPGCLAMHVFEELERARGRDGDGQLCGLSWIGIRGICSKYLAGRVCASCRLSLFEKKLPNLKSVINTFEHSEDVQHTLS